jgi:pSer/pThr/pTyr-binding forkhead associated (FHA) protein
VVVGGGPGPARGHPQHGPDPTVAAPPPEWSPPPRDHGYTPRTDPRAPSPHPQPPPPTPRRDRDPDPSATRIPHGAAAPAAGDLAGVLIAIEGDLKGEVFRILDGENRLGRGSHCSVVLASEWISRDHAIVVHQDGMFAIKPLKDSNPVLVNGDRTEGTAIQDGDVIRLGHTSFKLRTVQ